MGDAVEEARWLVGGAGVDGVVHLDVDFVMACWHVGNDQSMFHDDVHVRACLECVVPRIPEHGLAPPEMRAHCAFASHVSSSIRRVASHSQRSRGLVVYTAHRGGSE